MKIEAYYTFFVKLLGTAQEFKYSHLLDIGKVEESILIFNSFKTYNPTLNNLTVKRLNNQNIIKVP